MEPPGVVKEYAKKKSENLNFRLTTVEKNFLIFLI
jgi:hypothetical protein